MVRLHPLLAASVLLAACAGPGAARRAPSFEGLSAGLAGRAGSLAGHRGAFEVNGARFGADCSGFVAAVYEGEGIPLQRLAARAAPRETSGVAAIYQAAKRYGTVFGGGGEWPVPGDLVFFHDTYDRDRDGRAEDVFTHVGVVEYVSGGTVVFLHRGSKAVVRAALNVDHPDRAVGPDGLRMNSSLRDRKPPLRGGDTLAGQLFAGYGRIDPARVPAELR